MLILGFLLLLVLGFFAASWLALRVLQVITLVAIAMLLAAGMGALIFGGLIGLIAALVLQATLTADYPLLSIAAGLAVALLVTVVSLRRIVWEIHAARKRLFQTGGGKQIATQWLSPPKNRVEPCPFAPNPKPSTAPSAVGRRPQHPAAMC